MQDSPFTVLPTVSIRPNQIVSYNTFVRHKKQISPISEKPAKKTLALAVQFDAFDDILKENPHSANAPFRVFSPDPVEKKKIINKHNFELSRQGQKNLREKVSWLYYFAKNETITTSKGKILANFKMNFITLKLPSEQRHSSDFITKNCLNQLITELQKKWGFQNYVWRLEYQKNGNVHYHIATDSFVDFYWLRSTWNRILNKHNYVDAYKQKFNKMTFSEYCKSYDVGKDVDFETLKKRYADGRKSGWMMPNSVDVKSVSNAKNIAFYISKYMGKNSSNSGIKSLPVHELNSSNSRLWFCSRSLSKLTAFREFDEAMTVDLFCPLNQDKTVKKVIHDYCCSFYFSFTDITIQLKRVVAHLLRQYGIDRGYIASGTLVT